MRDRSAVTLIGPSPTPGQVVNGQITAFLYHCWSLLEKLENDHADSVFAVVKPGIQVRVFTYIIRPNLHTQY